MPKSPKKKSSKASSPSWRTLMRQAEKFEAIAGNTRKTDKDRETARRRGVALREQANLKHRSERKAKAPKASARKERIVTKKIRAAAAEALTTIANRIQPDQGLVNTAWQAREEQPGRGELVGGEMFMLAEQFATLARKKGGKDEITNKLLMATATARYEGERNADRKHMQNVKDIHEATTDKVVCAAIAVFDNDPQFRNGMPPAIMISSYTLCRMIDALNRAGYSAQGKR